MRRTLVGFIALGLLLAGCNKRTASEPSGSNTEPTSVHPVWPVKKSLRKTVEQPGSIQPYEETELHAKLAGFVATIHADIGQKVKGPKFDAKGKEVEPGEVLAELSVPELVQEANEKEARFRQAEAEVVQARRSFDSAVSNVKAMVAAVEEAKAGLTSAQAVYERWDSEAKRVTDLVKKGTLDGQTEKDTQKQLEVAKAGQAEAKAHVNSAEALADKARTDQEKSRADIDAALARVDVSRAEVARLKALLAYTVIRAPYDGIVTLRHISRGDFIQPSNSRGYGVFRVARLDPVRVVVQVPEADAALIDTKTEANLTIQAVRPPTVTGKVTRMSWTLDPATRTLRAEIDVPNPQEQMRPGMYVYARLHGQLPEEWVLPASAVVKQGEAHVCFLIVNGKAMRTPVQKGHGDAEWVQVLRRAQPSAPGGWTAFTGEEQVAEKAAGLTDGQAVQATPSK